MRKATTKKIPQFLEENVLMVYGVPNGLICDNGVQFASKEFQTKMKEYGVYLRLIPVYYPQVNPTERVKRDVKTMIPSYVK